MVTLPIRAFTSELSLQAIGAYAMMCARTDIDIHDDECMQKALSVTPMQWDAIKEELRKAAFYFDKAEERTDEEQEAFAQALCEELREQE